jgi:drug/metabolite transporter (DMT)-like permease
VRAGRDDLAQAGHGVPDLDVRRRRGDRAEPEAVGGAEVGDDASRDQRLAGLVGLCAAAATLFYQLAVRGELVSITAVLASLYPALTVVLAAIVLHERVHRVQAIGLALAAGAVALVALG